MPEPTNTPAAANRLREPIECSEDEFYGPYIAIPKTAYPDGDELVIFGATMSWSRRRQKPARLPNVGLCASMRRRRPIFSRSSEDDSDAGYAGRAYLYAPNRARAFTARSSRIDKRAGFLSTRLRDGTLLGTIRWFGRWRQYVFAPEPECVFNVGCLKTIERNVQVMNEIQKGRL